MATNFVRLLLCFYPYLPPSPSLPACLSCGSCCVHLVRQKQHQRQSRSRSRSQSKGERDTGSGSILISCILILFGDKSAVAYAVRMVSRINTYICTIYIKIFATFGLSHFQGTCSHKNKKKANKSQRSLASLSLSRSSPVCVSGIRLQCDLARSSGSSSGSSSCCFWAKMLSLEPEVAPPGQAHVAQHPNRANQSLEFSHDPRCLVSRTHSCWKEEEEQEEEQEETEEYPALSRQTATINFIIAE